jgi:hypothetical protein
MSTIATVYIVALIVGGGLILISTMLGSHGNADVHADLSAGVGVDHHFGGDGHHGTDVDHHAGDHGLSLASWFSMQFGVFFLAIFGLIGTAMTYASGVEAPTVLAAAIVGGAVVGQVVHQTLRALRKTSVGSDLTTQDYLDHAARVTIAFDASRRGEVAVASRNGERFLAAQARRDDDRFKVGDQVVVVGFVSGVAEVVSKTEHEFVRPTKTGAKA